MFNFSRFFPFITRSRSVRRRHTSRRWAWAALFVMGLGLVAPAVADAQLLTQFVNYYGRFYYRHSGNNGSTWESWIMIPYTGQTFEGPISVVSPSRGLLVAAAKTINNQIVYTTNTIQRGWDPWRVVPGATDGGGTKYCQGWFPVRCWGWNTDSTPVLSTRGPGIVELFINGPELATDTLPTPGFPGGGASSRKYLHHTWTDGIGTGGRVYWSGNFDRLASGDLKGTPAAISWGPGRTDVFVVGDGTHLYHRSYANGRWSSGVNFLGGDMFSSPSVLSMGLGHLDVYVQGPGQGLWRNYFNTNNNFWAGWEYLGGQLGIGTSPFAISRGYDTEDIFVYGGDMQIYKRSYNNGVWTATLNGPYWTGAHTTAVYWNP